MHGHTNARVSSIGNMSDRRLRWWGLLVVPTIILTAFTPDRGHSSWDASQVAGLVATSPVPHGTMDRCTCQVHPDGLGCRVDAISGAHTIVEMGGSRTAAKVACK